MTEIKFDRSARDETISPAAIGLGNTNQRDGVKNIKIL
jgi:hypothetical protein